MTYRIEMSKTIEVNTDPQRRCYNGCYFSSELVSTPWEVLVSGVKDDEIEDKLNYWRDLNAYAVSQRGESATIRYRKVLEE